MKCDIEKRHPKECVKWAAPSEWPLPTYHALGRRVAANAAARHARLCDIELRRRLAGRAVPSAVRAHRRSGLAAVAVAARRRDGVLVAGGRAQRRRRSERAARPVVGCRCVGVAPILVCRRSRAPTRLSRPRRSVPCVRTCVADAKALRRRRAAEVAARSLRCAGTAWSRSRRRTRRAPASVRSRRRVRATTWPQRAAAARAALR